MDIKVDTIVKWDAPCEDHEYDDGCEKCEDGQCVGIVTKVTDVEGNLNPPNWSEKDITVEWWRICPKHDEIDPDGTGPYRVRDLCKIGQLD